MRSLHSARTCPQASGPAPVPFLLALLPFLAFPPPARAVDTWGEAAAQTLHADSLWPAARRHIKQSNGRYYKWVSRLDRIVELNFTFGNGHQPGKAIIAASLDRIAATYGGITVQHFRQGTDGATGSQPDFTLDDFLSGQVIVANNVSMFGSTSMGAAKQQAIQTAIETEGRGYLGFHHGMRFILPGVAGGGRPESSHRHRLHPERYLRAHHDRLRCPATGLLIPVPRAV